MRVSVLLLSWEDEDPQLPVSQEIEKLETVFRLKYYFETAHFKIPDEDSHYRLTERVMAFVKPEKDSGTHLKILYYAGHGRLMQDRSLALTRYKSSHHISNNAAATALSSISMNSPAK
jgi:hypothetical protein